MQSDNYMNNNTELKYLLAKLVFEAKRDNDPLAPLTVETCRAIDELVQYVKLNY